MAGNTWWQRVIVSAFRGIRAGVVALLRPGKKAEESNALIQDQEKNQEIEELTEDSPKLNSNPAPEAEPVVNPPAQIAEENPAIEPVPEETAEQQDHLPKGAAEDSPRREPGVETGITAPAPQGRQNLDQSFDTAESAEEAAPEQPAVPQLPPQAASAAPQVPDPEMPEIEEAFEPEDVEEIVETDSPAEEPAAQPEPFESVEEAELDEAAEPESPHQASDEQNALPGQAIEETIVTPEIETEATAQQPDLEAEPGLLAEEESDDAEFAEEATADEEVLIEEVSVEETLTEEAPVEETQPAEQPITEAPADEAAAPEPTESQPEPTAAQPEAKPAVEATVASAAPESPATPQVPAKPAAGPPQVAQVVHEAIKREQGPDTSPVSVIVSQVYEGPFDLLLDLIRKQDIDIYNIPIAKITAQFLAYVDKLKASDVDVAGEFIYTASLLIHIKSKMLLPREPKGPGEEAEDPRRELVERLLEHERFKNAAQMLQQKQMLEAATWTNPGMREFRDDAGAEPEIAADTVDLVRVFREILDRARNRPVLNLQEDSVTVGQMIQFLGRRLTMEDKPVALRRLLAHTKSERALIAMFLALLELVRLQAILLRQDHHFTEIFIKKNTGFDAVINEGMARDDWQ